MGLQRRNTKVQNRQNRVRTFENMVMSYFQATRPECKNESYYTTVTQKKTVFEAMGCCFHFCPCQEARPSLTDVDIKRRTKKREMDALRKGSIREMVHYRRNVGV